MPVDLDVEHMQDLVNRREGGQEALITHKLKPNRRREHLDIHLQNVGYILLHYQYTRGETKGAKMDAMKEVHNVKIECEMIFLFPF